MIAPAVVQFLIPIECFRAQLITQLKSVKIVTHLSSLSLALPISVGEIRPYLFEPETSTSGSESGEELEVDDRSGEERLENTSW